MIRRLLLIVLAACLASCATPGGPSPDEASHAVISNAAEAQAPAPSQPSHAASPMPGDPEIAMADVPRAVVSTDAARAAATGINDLGFDLLRTLTTEANTVISPASIAIALGMTRAGARGSTATEMDAVMGGVGAPENAASLNALDAALAARSGTFEDVTGETHDITLRIANAPFTQRGMPIEPDYLATLAETYGTGIRLVDYIADHEGARQSINAWVDEATEERIPKLLPEDSLDSLTRFVLVNAIYLKAAWRFPFHEASTAPGPFTRADGTRIEVPMMAASHHMLYAEDDGWQAVELPYVGGQLSMLLIRPDDAPAFLAGVNAASLDDIVAALDPGRVVELSMPKFSIETTEELTAPLQSLGMESAFSDVAADFSGITRTERLFISGVIHQANIDVDEAGTEAAAATAVVGSTTGGPPPETVRMALDRPFVFVLRDMETGAVLFLGTVGDPGEG